MAPEGLVHTTNYLGFTACERLGVTGDLVDAGKARSDISCTAGTIQYSIPRLGDTAIPRVCARSRARLCKTYAVPALVASGSSIHGRSECSHGSLFQGTFQNMTVRLEAHLPPCLSERNDLVELTLFLRNLTKCTGDTGPARENLPSQPQ